MNLVFYFEKSLLQQMYLIFYIKQKIKSVLKQLLLVVWSSEALASDLR